MFTYGGLERHPLPSRNQQTGRGCLWGASKLQLFTVVCRWEPSPSKNPGIFPVLEWGENQHPHFLFFLQNEHADGYPIIVKPGV